MKAFLVSVITILAICETTAQEMHIPPKVLINITIDQLRYDYIERFYPLFGEKGFKKLLKSGRVYRNGYHEYINPDIASSITSIQTGTYPSIHGIISAEWYDREKRKTINCVEDSKYLGNYVNKGYSPNRIMVSTIADELKISTLSKSLIYSIGPNAESAILSGGRNADIALWLNEESGKWCTSTYYRELPYWVSSYNDSTSVDFKIDNTEWRPLLNPDKYTYLTSEWVNNDFRHRFKSYKYLKYRKFIKSGLVNNEMNNMAIECMENSPIGEDDITDMLCVTFYAGNFDDRSTIECPAEIQDTYVRLDRELARMIDVAEKEFGPDNFMIVISSTGYTTKETQDLGKYNIPTGEFYINRCSALLNMYLMAQFGEGDYVEGFHKNQIYLDLGTLKEKKLDYKTILDNATDFLITFSGVSQVYSSDNILTGPWTPDMQKWKNTYNRHKSGDLFLELLPGWSAREEDSYEYRIERAGFTASPIIFWGNSIKGEIIDTPVRNDIIAPTVAYYLRIRAPNAAKERPVTNLK